MKTYPIQVSDRGNFDFGFETAQKKKREEEVELGEIEEELKRVEDVVIPKLEAIAGTTGEIAENKHKRNRRILGITLPTVGVGGAAMVYLTLVYVFATRKIIAAIGAMVFGIGGYLGVESLLFYLHKRLPPRRFLTAVVCLAVAAVAAFLIGLGYLHHVRGKQAEMDALIERLQDSYDDPDSEEIQRRIEELKEQIGQETAIGTMVASLGTEAIMGIVLFRVFLVFDMLGALAEAMKYRRRLRGYAISLKKSIAGEGGMSNEYHAGRSRARASDLNNNGVPIY